MIVIASGWYDSFDREMVAKMAGCEVMAHHPTSINTLDWIPYPTYHIYKPPALDEVIHKYMIIKYMNENIGPTILIEPKRQHYRTLQNHIPTIHTNTPQLPTQIDHIIQKYGQKPSPEKK